MYSNRYVALHCCQQKYLAEIMKDGIKRESKAVFICELKKINNKELCNTLAILIYHGIGIDGWNKILNEGQNLNKIDSNLVIVVANFSKEQEKIINNNNKILNYYKVYKDKDDERTMNYCKIKDIGKVKKITSIEKISLDNIYIKNNMKKINPIKERFFIKNIYNDLEIKNSKIMNEVEKLCYKIANENLTKIKEDILATNKF